MEDNLKPTEAQAILAPLAGLAARRRTESGGEFSQAGADAERAYELSHIYHGIDAKSAHRMAACLPRGCNWSATSPAPFRGEAGPKLAEAQRDYQAFTRHGATFIRPTHIRLQVVDPPPAAAELADSIVRLPVHRISYGSARIETDDGTIDGSLVIINGGEWWVKETPAEIDAMLAPPRLVVPDEVFP